MTKLYYYHRKKAKRHERQAGNFKSVDAGGKTQDESTNNHKGQLTETREFRYSRLSFRRFMSLPPSVMARVCRFLHPSFMLSLARSSKSMRELFMSKGSKPFWDAARNLPGIPNWRGVAAPEATVFLFTDMCQGIGCDEPASLEAFHLCRRYCNACAAENLVGSEDVAKDFPDLPRSLLGRLPWTKHRSADKDQQAQAGRYYLKRDVIKLWRTVRTHPHLGPSIIAELHSKLVLLQRERAAATAEVQQWYRKEIRSRRQLSSERWNEIRSVMRKRWGWKPVPYERLSPFLKPMVDHLFNVPSLSPKVWDRVRGDMAAVIRDEARVHDVGARPFFVQHHFQYKLSS